MSLEVELTAELPPYEQLPATRRLIEVLQDRKAVELGNLRQHVENMQSHLSSSRADDGTITGIMEMCSEEFSQLMVQKRFGIDPTEWNAYEAFVTEVTSELKRKDHISGFNGQSDVNHPSGSQSRLKGTTPIPRQEASLRGAMNAESSARATYAQDGKRQPLSNRGAYIIALSHGQFVLTLTEENSKAVEEEESPPYSAQLSMHHETASSSSSTQTSAAPAKQGPTRGARMANAAALGLGGAALVPVAAAAGIAGATVGAVSVIIGGVGGGLNMAFNGGVAAVIRQPMSAPIVAPVAAVAGITGGAITGASLLTGGISQGFMMTCQLGMAQTASMFRQARDLVSEEPKEA